MLLQIITVLCELVASSLLQRLTEGQELRDSITSPGTALSLPMLLLAQPSTCLRLQPLSWVL